MSDSNEINTILYATDLGKGMRPVFRKAVSFAHNFKANIVMLHVVEPLGSTGEAVLSLYLPQKKISDIEHENLELVIETMQKRLEKFCAEEKEHCDGEHALVSDLVVKSGHAAEVIPRVAKERNADLIIVGSHTKQGANHTLLGSTSRAVTHESKIPVLVVPNQESG